ncbi:hypothetical protein EB155_02960 [archaeon]|jgi:hypothetical protein|nr:hypothetical protein [archaeon]NDB78802.1 hypothetical protein [archaeon]
MAFPFYKSIDGYITNELQARTSNNNVELSKLVPWIQATSNLGSRYTLGTETYTSLFTGGGNDAYGNIAGSQWRYRPNPIITDFSVDFASRGTLRRCTLKIKCFSPDQLTKVQTYFMEPGISTYIQWGWNYSISGRKAIGPTPIDSGTIKNYYRNPTSLNNIRSTNNGCYDNFVGIISGGESTINGNEFDVTIKLVSIGELLMGLPRDPVQDNQAKIEPTNYPVQKLNSYLTSRNVKANFAYFFDQLPDSLRTPELLALEDDFKPESDFINYNETLIEEAKYETTSGTFSGDLLIQSVPALSIQAMDAESPVNASKYVSFEAFIKLLNNTRIKFSDDGLKLDIDITDSYCGAFKGIFSTDEAVFIPNKECRGFLNDIALLKGSTVGSMLNFKINNSVGGRSFMRSTATTVTIDGDSVTLPAYTHGWIGDLYIENSIAMDALENQTASVKEVLDSVLSRISEAVEGLWAFQIVEADNGTRLRIADGNLRNQRTSSITSFNMFGTDSFFLDASFNLDIPKAMMGQIVMEKSTDVEGTDTLTKGLFSDQKDTVLGDEIKKEAAANKKAEPQTEWEERLWIEFRRNIRIMINPKFVLKEDIGDGNLAEWCIYSHFLNKRVFNDQRKGDLYTGGEVYNGRPAPVGFDFTVLGMSGFQVGQLFNVVGLPPQYSSAKGAFQIEEVTHKIDSKQWITEVKSHFRPFYK